MKSVGDKISANSGAWSFGGSVAKNFNDHVSKSVPLYNEGHEMIVDLSEFFVSKNSVVYELGCSTGTLISKVAERNSANRKAIFYGIDCEKNMVVHAKKLAKKRRQSGNVIFKKDDIRKMQFKMCDLVICYYTVQFIRPAFRQNILSKIYQTLNWGGALIMFEKVRGADARFQDILTTLYNEYKLRKGYTCNEIIDKTRSLKGVLEPFSSQANLEMLKRAGFTDVNSIQKYLCFEGFLAIK
jgi:tRNA (cmo5U34)-methyltransferase